MELRLFDPTYHIYFLCVLPPLETPEQVIVVTDQFEGKPLVARHRMVNALFADEMTGKTPVMHGEKNIRGRGHATAPRSGLPRWVLA